MASQFIIDLPPLVSDGSEDNYPDKNSAYVRRDSGLHNDFFRERLAKLWMTGQGASGVKYMFKNLPPGYAAFTKQRPDGKIDRYIFGHVNRKFYDSPNRFFPHLQYLAGATNNCSCVNCTLEDKRTRVKTLTDPQSAKSKPAIYRHPNETLRLEKIFNCQAFLRSLSLPVGNAELDSSQPEYPVVDSQFSPRFGEIVLYCINGKVQQDPKSGRIGIEKEDIESDSEWRAGLVQSISGPRVEITTFKPHAPAGNTFEINTDQQIPFSFYYEVLKLIPEQSWHLSIHQALEVMPTMCLGRAEYIPSLTLPSQRQEVFIRGIWIGSEWVAPGDWVRIVSDSKEPGCAGVMEVGYIFVRLEKWDEPQEMPPSDKIRTCFGGRIFSFNPEQPEFRSNALMDTERAHLPDTLRDTTLYPHVGWQDDSQTLQTIDTTSFLGRLHEQPGSIDLFEGQRFNIDTRVVTMTRVFGRAAPRHMDQHLNDKSCIKWTIFDNREESLAHETIVEDPDDGNVTLHDDPKHSTSSQSFKSVTTDARSEVDDSEDLDVFSKMLVTEETSAEDEEDKEETGRREVQSNYGDKGGRGRKRGGRGRGRGRARASKRARI